MVPANVVESPQLAVLPPRDDNWFSSKIQGEEVPLVPHLIGAPHHLPAFRKHALLFEFVDARIEIPRRRNRPCPLQRIIRIVEFNKVPNVSLHQFPPCLPSSSRAPLEALLTSYPQRRREQSEKGTTIPAPQAPHKLAQPVRPGN